MNVNKKIFSALIAASFLIPAAISARPIPSPMKFGFRHDLNQSVNSSLEMSGDPPAFMFILTGGVLAGGKQNTCYLAKGKVHIRKFSADASMYQHFYGDRLFNANIAVGNIVAFSAGVEFGDRTYFVNKDSTFEHIKFQNAATGEYEPYSSFTGFSMPQDIVSYNIGITFGGRFKQTNLWRGVGQCWSWVSLKWEVMYAPKVGYDKTLVVTTQGPFQANTTTYNLEGIKDRNWGFRMIFESRLGGKIGWMLETGMRPGIRYEVNEEGRFSNGYLRMGVTMALSVGGRKDLDRPGFGRAVPEN